VKKREEEVRNIIILHGTDLFLEKRKRRFEVLRSFIEDFK
jgi:hypothetical protein